MTLLQRLKKYRPDWVTLILIGLVVYVWFRPPAKVTDEQRPAPAVQVAMLNGQMLNLTDLRGQVVVVNFWATWCPYCRKEMPDLERFYQAYRSKGVTVLALSLDDDPEKAAKYIKDAGYQFPVGMSDPVITQRFGGVSVVPSSFIIDRQGNIRKHVAGQVYYGRLEDLVAPLLGAQ